MDVCICASCLCQESDRWTDLSTIGAAIKDGVVYEPSSWKPAPKELGTLVQWQFSCCSPTKHLNQWGGNKRRILLGEPQQRRRLQGMKPFVLFRSSRWKRGCCRNSGATSLIRAWSLTNCRPAGRCSQSCCSARSSFLGHPSYSYIPAIVYGEGIKGADRGQGIPAPKRLPPPMPAPRWLLPPVRAPRWLQPPVPALRWKQLNQVISQAARIISRARDPSSS